MQGDQCCALHPFPRAVQGSRDPWGSPHQWRGSPFGSKARNLQLSEGPHSCPPPHHSQESRTFMCEMRGVQKTHIPPPESTYCLRGKKINDPVSLQKSYSGACAGNKKVEGPLRCLWGQSCARGAAEHTQPQPCTEAERVLGCFPRRLSSHSTIQRECTVPLQGGFTVGTRECWGLGVGKSIPVLPQAVLHPLLQSVTHNCYRQKPATQILSRKLYFSSPIKMWALK